MSTFKQVQAQQFTLAGSGVTATATSITLTSFKQIDGSTNLTTADFGSIGYAVLEPGTSREESISFTTVTQNANGTATLTGVVRGLQFVSPYTTSSALKQAHAGGTPFILTNSASYYEEFVDVRNTQDVSGVKTFTTVPKTSAGDPVDATDLARKQYVDDTVNGGAVSNNRTVVAGTAGETITTGQLVYFDETDNEWKLTDADTASTVDRVLLGIAQGAGTNGNAITGGVLILGTDANQTGLTIGDKMFASNTAGAIANSAGTTEVEVGIAKSATELYFNPRYASMPTADETDALAGTSGTPSASNKFVTALDTSFGNFVTFTFGETIAIGEAVYLKSSDQKVYKTDASFDDERIHSFVGVAKEAGNVDEEKQVFVSGLASGLTGLTAGSRYYLSNTAGAIAVTPGDFKKHIGITESTTTLLVQNQANISDFGSPTRVIGDSYQNGNNWRMVLVSVNLTTASLNKAEAKIGVASAGTTIMTASADGANDGADTNTPMTFLVPPNYFYSVAQSNGTVIKTNWYEADLRW